MSEPAKVKQKKSTSFMLVLWYLGMFSCTLSLYVIGVFFKDSSVFSYVALGTLAMILIPVVKMINAVIRNNELRRENAERERKAAEKRREKRSEEEQEEHEREKNRASIELAQRHQELNKSMKKH
jgi:type VI protein secretion system component VasK